MDENERVVHFANWPQCGRAAAEASCCLSAAAALHAPPPQPMPTHGERTAEDGRGGRRNGEHLSEVSPL